MADTAKPTALQLVNDQRLGQYLEDRPESSRRIQEELKEVSLLGNNKADTEETAGASGADAACEEVAQPVRTVGRRTDPFYTNREQKASNREQVLQAKQACRIQEAIAKKKRRNESIQCLFADIAWREGNEESNARQHLEATVMESKKRAAARSGPPAEAPFDAHIASSAQSVARAFLPRDDFNALKNKAEVASASSQLLEGWLATQEEASPDILAMVTTLQQQAAELNARLTNARHAATIRLQGMSRIWLMRRRVAGIRAMKRKKPRVKKEEEAGFLSGIASSPLGSFFSGGDSNDEEDAGGEDTAAAAAGGGFMSGFFDNDQGGEEEETADEEQEENEEEDDDKDEPKKEEMEEEPHEEQEQEEQDKESDGFLGSTSLALFGTNKKEIPQDESVAEGEEDTAVEDKQEEEEKEEKEGFRMPEMGLDIDSMSGFFSRLTPGNSDDEAEDGEEKESGDKKKREADQPQEADAAPEEGNEESETFELPELFKFW